MSRLICDFSSHLFFALVIMHELSKSVWNKQSHFLSFLHLRCYCCLVVWFSAFGLNVIDLRYYFKSLSVLAEIDYWSAVRDAKQKMRDVVVQNLQWTLYSESVLACWFTSVKITCEEHILTVTNCNTQWWARLATILLSNLKLWQQKLFQIEHL